MTRYYKATRPDGTDFHTGTVDYAAALDSGEVITHPAAEPGAEDAVYYLSLSTSPTDCTGLSWPCRLFAVDPVGPTWVPHPASLPNKVACVSGRVVEELPATDALGPHGEQIVALIERCKTISLVEAENLYAAGDAAGDAAGAVARAAAWYAAGAAAGLLVRDLIGQHGFTQQHYDTLTRPWRTAIGPIHPDDPDLREVTA